MQEEFNPAFLLRQHELRATAARVRLVSQMQSETFPRTAEYFAKTLPEVDRVTVYRMLEAFLSAGIARRASLGHGHAHYEFVPGRPRHHHVICTRCGLIEDIPSSEPDSPEAQALGVCRNFRHIDSHSFEFFGRCVTCA